MLSWKRFVITICVGAPAAQAAPSSEATAYQWTKVAQGEHAGGLQVTGRVIPQDGALSIESARVAGRVTSILRREGERVSAGMPLFAISSAECWSLQGERRVAEAKGLADFQDSTRRRSAQLNLVVDGERCQIIATSSGILAKRNVESGAAFNVGDPLATVLDVKRLGVELDIPERSLLSVQPGQKVKLQLASDQARSVDTAVEQVLPTLDTASRTGKVRLRPVALPVGVTLDALVFADISTGADTPLLQVPSAALVFDHGKQYVLKKQGEKPQAVLISVISESDQLSSVRPVNSGDLRQGDEVVAQAAIFAYRRLRGEAAP